MSWIFFWMFSSAEAQVIPQYVDELEGRALKQISRHIQNAEYAEACEFLEEYSNKIAQSETLMYDTALMLNQSRQIEDTLLIYAQLLQMNYF